MAKGLILIRWLGCNAAGRGLWSRNAVKENK